MPKLCYYNISFGVYCVCVPMSLVFCMFRSVYRATFPGCSNANVVPEIGNMQSPAENCLITVAVFRYSIFEFSFQLFELFCSSFFSVSGSYFLPFLSQQICLPPTPHCQPPLNCRALFLSHKMGYIMFRDGMYTEWIIFTFFVEKRATEKM